MSRSTEVDVAVVGAGVAGLAVATLLARSGHEVLVVERSPHWRWRACGVFASPAAGDALLRIGLDESALDAVSRPIPAMRLETPGGTRVRLTYGDDGSLRRPALGFDRGALDAALLGLARRAGADVRPGHAIQDGSSIEPVLDAAPPLTGTRSPGGAPAFGPRAAPSPGGAPAFGPRAAPSPGGAPAFGPRADARPALVVRGPAGPEHLRARIVVGADGLRSTVARLAGVTRPSRLATRVGLTFNVDDPRPALTPDARMIVLPGAYCGLAPVPDGGLNVGIVLAGREWRVRLWREGAERVVRQVLQMVPAADDDRVEWANMPRRDPITGAIPLGHRVSRRAGKAWLLVGDAAGFLDPFTGEGLHRALASAELAAEVVDARLRGRAATLGAYERGMRRHFRTKDVVSLVTLAMLARPALFEYTARRLARRARVRETMGLVMGDLAPASRALDPRFLAALLHP